MSDPACCPTRLLVALLSPLLLRSAPAAVPTDEAPSSSRAVLAVTKPENVDAVRQSQSPHKSSAKTCEIPRETGRKEAAPASRVSPDNPAGPWASLAVVNARHSAEAPTA
jgi:hypothetical protein